MILVGFAVALAVERRQAAATLGGSGPAARMELQFERVAPVPGRAPRRQPAPALKAAERLGITHIEADVRLYRKRLDIRHLKTVGPLPIYWDRWLLEAPWRPRLELHELLEATAPDTELVLDLKGRRVPLAERVLEAIAPYLAARQVHRVCAQLERARAVRRHAQSAPSTRWEARVSFASSCAASPVTQLEGVSIHERLLDADSAAALRAIAETIMTWPVNRPERARELLGLGVDGLITDDAAAISRADVLGATT